jgi:hypothetical protein
MSLHTARRDTPVRHLAAELLKATGRRRRTLLRTVLDMAGAGEQHAMWCLLGDAVDHLCSLVITWVAILAGGIAVLALGVTIGYVGGPVAALAYVLALIVAVLVWFRWDGGTP